MDSAAVASRCFSIYLFTYLSISEDITSHEASVETVRVASAWIMPFRSAFTCEQQEGVEQRHGKVVSWVEVQSKHLGDG